MAEIERTKVRVQPVLKLYLDLSKTNYLHFGYWQDGDPMDLAHFQAAQRRYLDHLVENIPKEVKSILDVGCGVGGNAIKFKELGYQVAGISPDPYQEELFKKNTKGQVPFFLTTLEDFKTDQKFDLILMSESAQYIPYEEALVKVKALLTPKGFLLVSDYFKRPNAAEEKNLPSFLLEPYLRRAKELGFKIVKQEDITRYILPTLVYGSDVFYNYIKPVLDCIMTTMEVHIRPAHWLFNLLLQLRVRGKTLRQIIKNNIVPLPKETFEKYLTYQVILLQREA